jgi:hypothetical protein
MRMVKHAGFIAAVALGMTLLSASSQADDSRKGTTSSSSRGNEKAGRGSGFQGQIAVPPPFARGTAFLLMGSDDCYLESPWAWASMAQDTRNASERAGGLESPGLPIACVRTGQSATCKVFKDGMTYAFTAVIKTDTTSQLVLGTSGGFIEIAIDLQKRTGTFKQIDAEGQASTCAGTYKSREDAAGDVEKLDPAPGAALPAKDRANGMSSGGDRLKCKSRNQSSSATDPLTGRRAHVCAACSGECWFVGEECVKGTCVYTGKGDNRGSYGDESSSSGSSSKSDSKKQKKALGEKCQYNDDCASKKCGTLSSGSLHKCVSR